jgi:hypothetical protein
MSKSTPNTPETWEALLDAVRETEHDLVGVAPFRDTLADAHTRALLLKDARETQKVAAREASRSHREAMTAGRDAAVALRGYVQSVLGMRNEKLLRYGIQPRGRRRCRKRKPGPVSHPACKRAPARSK